MTPNPLPRSVFAGKPKFTHSAFPPGPLSERRILDQRYVEIVEARSAKRVSPERSEAPLIRAGSSGNFGRNKKEGAVVRAAPEVILAHRAARRKVRHSH